MSPLDALAAPAAALRTIAVRFDVEPAPAWLASAGEALERERIVEVVASARESVALVAPRERGLQRLSVTLDAWLARRILHAPEQAWRPSTSPTQPKRVRPAIVLGIDAPPAPDGDAERWWLAFGASGTRYAEELARGDAVLEIELRARGRDGVDVVLARTRTKAARSLFLSRSRAGWKAAGLLERRLRARATRASADAELAPGVEHAGPRAHAAHSAPASLIPRRSAAGFASRAFGRAFALLAREDAWRLAWRRLPKGSDGRALGPPRADSWSSEHELVAPRGSFYADPFLLEHAGREALFFELYDSTLGRGTLAAVELDARGAPGPLREILRAKHHLSYPYVFQHAGEAWMIPETHAARRVELWRARAFPFEWERATTLLDGIDAVDTTWFEHEGRYWLLACVARPHAPRSEELCAFWSEHPFGPWRPHAANPIVDDPCGSRPAGRPFVHEGRLIRPAQDVALEYGGRILFQDVLALDPLRYAERTLGAFDPEGRGGIVGAHTYDRSARHEVVDLRCTRWRRPAWTRWGRA